MAHGWACCAYVIPSTSVLRLYFAPCNGIRNPWSFCLWNPGSGIFLVLESAILEFGFQNAVQGIRNPTNDWNPESRFQWQRLESRTRNPESTAWNPKSKTVLDSVTWCDLFLGASMGLGQAVQRRLLTIFPPLCRQFFVLCGYMPSSSPNLELESWTKLMENLEAFPPYK